MEKNPYREKFSENCRLLILLNLSYLKQWYLLCLDTVVEILLKLVVCLINWTTQKPLYSVSMGPEQLRLGETMY